MIFIFSEFYLLISKVSLHHFIYVVILFWVPPSCAITMQKLVPKVKSCDTHRAANDPVHSVLRHTTFSHLLPYFRCLHDWRVIWFFLKIQFQEVVNPHMNCAPPLYFSFTNCQEHISLMHIKYFGINFVEIKFLQNKHFRKDVDNTKLPNTSLITN